jgi:hypothetical protein
LQQSVLVVALLVMWVQGMGAAARPLEDVPTAAARERTAAAAAQTSTCDLIESSAAANGLPVAYFTRLIWKESSFRATAVSPVGAQGIAQFMPGTAAERGLADPFDPLQAIPASARLLKSLALRFGNPGLAAAAYNAGPKRVADWLAGTGDLPRETRSYVAAVTGRTAQEWRDLSEEPSGEQVAAPHEEPEAATCLEVLAALDAPLSMDSALQAPEEGAEWQPWGVQVAGNFSQAKALATYRSLQARHPAVLADRAPLIVRQRNLSFGPRAMVNVRLPAPTRDAANDLCRRLREAGAPCVVLNN